MLKPSLNVNYLTYFQTNVTIQLSNFSVIKKYNEMLLSSPKINIIIILLTRPKISL